MKVIWAYENLTENPCGLSQLEVLMLISSVLQWRKYYPEDTRVFYCDESSRRFIGSLGIPNLFNEVISFYREDFSLIDPQVFWSRIKLGALREQEEPVILMDHDFIPLSPLKSFLDPNKVCYCNREDSIGYYPSGTDSYVRRLSLKARWPSSAVNVGFLHMPFPEFTRYYAELSLEMMKEFSSFGVPHAKYLIFAEQMLLSWLLQEVPHESLMRPVWKCVDHVWDEQNIDETGLFSLREAQKGKFFHYGRAKKHYSPQEFHQEFTWLAELSGVSQEVLIKIKELQGFEHS